MHQLHYRDKVLLSVGGGSSVNCGITTQWLALIDASQHFPHQQAQGTWPATFYSWPLPSDTRPDASPYLDVLLLQPQVTRPHHMGHLARLQGLGVRQRLAGCIRAAEA
jgi:hypothetical protein